MRNNKNRSHYRKQYSGQDLLQAFIELDFYETHDQFSGVRTSWKGLGEKNRYVIKEFTGFI